ncbi:MAG: flagellar export protein FliJ [Dehalococcoidia bacterium]|nr:flagellar export protein FliJ [Dehalococcoidia bacterium]
MSDAFRLQQLLDLRRRAEEEKAISLATAEAEHQHLQFALQMLLPQEAAQLASMASAGSTGSLDPVNVEATRLYLEHLEGSIQRQHEQMAEVSVRVNAQRAELIEATREKRLLERLEERHDETVATEASRLENAQTDEIAAQRHRRLHGMGS